ncbi:VOC family protein [Halobacillus sp. A5]|uniref:VOC family protein n=1 Tax=Halobacillus sp. A5 TaxID=2880263 RepID=UPI0020A63927|nr:VOC family protein [Halobacillus sp. A5]MCP3027202.1 VOC family protein [Halobacillus sp. A5]
MLESWNYMRLARPTNKLEEMRTFYEKVLGLEKIGEFNHNGYHGLLIGLPDQKVHLELLQSDHDFNTVAPNDDHLLVFYLHTIEQVEAVRTKLKGHGVEPVEPVNPYWKDKAYTFEDPEGWRVVFCIDINKYKQGERIL